MWMWRACCRRRLRCLLEEAVRHSSHFGSRSIVVRSLREALVVISCVLVLCVSQSQRCFVAATQAVLASTIVETKYESWLVSSERNLESELLY